MTSKWWGWGEEGKTYHLPDAGHFWAYVRARLGFTEPASRIESLESIRLRPPRLPERLLSTLAGITGDQGILTDDADRAPYSVGKGYKDLVRIRRGEVPSPTDAVARLHAEEQVIRLIDIAVREGVAVIPFGGGTSVVGGVEPAGDGPALTVDLRGLSRVVQIDRDSATAVVEAGILGPELERQLNATGFTLGHYPQSFEYSTLGGWIATRSAGQNSTMYGKIEDRVEALRLCYPGGLLVTPSVPAAAAGPDLVQVVCGSEGTLGIITQATLRLALLPRTRDYRGYLFRRFADGVNASRELMQAGLHPAVLRLSDEAETESTLAMRPQPHGGGAIIERAGRWYLAGRGFRLESGAIMILGFEGEEATVKRHWSTAEPILKRSGCVSLGRGPGRAWERSRFEAPYLRDLLLDHGIMVDTLETATSWDRYLALHAAVGNALRQALGERSVVMAHLSHAYTDGGSIYYTFLAPQEPGREIEQWERIKVAATDAIILNGGALSHHHGIGAEHRPWMESYVGPDGAWLLAGIKTALDPRGVMNPGKLLPNSPKEAPRHGERGEPSPRG